MEDDSVFDRFLERHASDLSRIAGASKGEWKTGDVRNEAWLLAFDIGARRGQSLDLGDAADATLLLRHLYNHCVKYSERVVRYATRLDHPSGGDGDRDNHWLNDWLAADEGAHPLSLLEGLESAQLEPDSPDPYHSAAAGWAWLLRRFDQRFADVAAFLLISASWCYDRYRKARLDAATQWPLPHGATAGDRGDAIGPWRKFKLPGVEALDDSRQLALDYWDKPEQPAYGQLWLL